MTHDEMRTAYHARSASRIYCYGFTYRGHLYYIMLSWEELCRLLKNDRAAMSKGGMLKLRVKGTSAVKAELLASGRAVELGAENLLETADKWNKGERFERIITELLTGEEWHKDSVPFWMAGDITLNGEEIQIKLDGAELTNERTMAKLLAS